MSLATNSKYNSHAHKRNLSNRSIKNFLAKSLKQNGLKNSLRPITKMNKGIVSYVSRKPYQSLGIATLFAGAVIGFLYKYFNK